MPEFFQSIHFNVAAETDESLKGIGSRPLVMRAGPARAGAPTAFDSDEAAARFYLSNIFARDTRGSVRGLTAPQNPQIVPDLQLRDSQQSPFKNTSIVRFVQTKSSIPVFGSRAIVELDDKRELLAIDAELADVEGVASIANLSPRQALENIAEKAAVKIEKLDRVAPPTLTFFRDEDKNNWHLAYYFLNVPAAPPTFFKGIKSYGGHRSIAASSPELNYLIDAHDGATLMYWSSSPTLVRCKGEDEDGHLREFYGEQGPEGTFVLLDTLRRVRTVDLRGQSIHTSALPINAVANAATVFENCEAAISAHYNASLVCDFLRTVLRRDGIDGKGMELVSYINCTSPADEPPPEWHNAAWWKQRMWYGQTKDGSGKLRSFARHLDIIAHELAHGLTEFTSDLAYFRQSGALNESFSDIFGIIISNWDPAQPYSGGDTATWTWQIGPGLGDKGLPLRDFADPTRTGDPAHMDNYDNTTDDNGGVHANSNIHNKAAYNFLVAKDAQGAGLFTPLDVAILYYQTLMRLDKLATFKQTLDTLLNIAGVYFAGDPQRRAKLAAVSEAYSAVGIT